MWETQDRGILAAVLVALASGRFVLVWLFLLCDSSLVCLGDMERAARMRRMNFKLSSLLRTREIRQFVLRHTGMPPVWFAGF